MDINKRMEMEPALLQSIILSDYAVREQGTGKMTLVGVFHQYNLPQTPAAVPPFFVTVAITNLRGKIESLPVTVRIEEMASSAVVGSATGKIASKAELTVDNIVEIPFPFPHVVFQSVGLYKIVVLVNNEPVGNRTFMVRTITAAAQQDV